MNDAIREGLNEQLSALLDGELPPEETGLLLRRLPREAELRMTLARYGTVGEVLRGARTLARPDFALRVSTALAAEPAHAAGPAPVGPAPEARRQGRDLRWLKPLGGLAVAATVAGLAVIVLQREPALDGTAAAPQVAAVAPAPVAGRVPSGEPLLAQQTPLSGSDEPASYVTPEPRAGVGAIPPALLANYVVAHSEFSSPLGRRSVLTGLIAEEAVASAAEAR